MKIFRRKQKPVKPIDPDTVYFPPTSAVYGSRDHRPARPTVNQQLYGQETRELVSRIMPSERKK